MCLLIFLVLLINTIESLRNLKVLEKERLERITEQNGSPRNAFFKFAGAVPRHSFLIKDDSHQDIPRVAFFSTYKDIYKHTISNMEGTSGAENIDTAKYSSVPRTAPSSHSPASCTITSHY